MKNIKYILTFLTLVLSVNIFAQTPFPSGIRFPNLKQVTAADSIPVFGANGILKSWIHKDSIGAAKSLQEVTDVGYTTTNPIETSSYLQSGEYVEVPTQSKYWNLLKNSSGNTYLRIKDSNYNATPNISKFEKDGSIFFGENAGSEAYKDRSSDNVMIGYNAGLNVTSSRNTVVGTNALSGTSGGVNTLFGHGAGEKIAINLTGFGYNVFKSSTGLNANAFGSSSANNNFGNSINAFGGSALGANRGNNSNGFGNGVMWQNSGNEVNGFGHDALRTNHGSNSVGFGNKALNYNNYSNNSGFGTNSFSGFYEDTDAKQDFLPEDIDPVDLRGISIPNHGFISENNWINLKYTTTGMPMRGFVNGNIYILKIIDSNTLSYSSLITNPGTGIHTFTPQYQYTNSTTIGANSHPTDSNQITLGDSNVTEIDTYGRHRSRAYGQGHVTGTPTYNLAVDSAGRFVETEMGGVETGTLEELNTGTSLIGKSQTSKNLNDWLDGKTPNLQKVTDLGYITTNPIEVSNYVKIEGEYVTSALFNENKVILKNDKNLPIIKEMKTTYNGTSLVSDVGLFLGENSGNYNKGRYSNGFGRNALQWNTGINSSGFGDGALSNNKGDYSNGFGNSALNGNEGNDVNGFGRAALMFNEGNNSNGYGSFSLQYNLGNDANGFGNSALNLNKGNHANGFGTSSLRINIGDNATGIGERALTTNSGNNNTALGHNSFGGFYPNSTNAITINTDNTSPSTSLITIPSHNLGPANSNVLLRYSSVNNALSYGHMSIQQFLVIDSNTLKAYASFTIRNQGNFILTPSYIYSNSTALGANSNPNKSNQVVLGDPNVTEITMGNRSILNAIETPDTLSEINLSAIGGNLCNMDSANSSANYDVISTQLNGNAIILINCSVQPTITGGTLISGDEFTPDTDMYMNVRYMGIARGVEYSFKKI